MEEETPKYRVVYRPGTKDENDPMNEYLEKINALADVGYRVHTFTYDCSLLSLHSNKFEGITNLKDIQPSEVDRYLLQGWEILDTYSKLIRIVKRSN